MTTGVGYDVEADLKVKNQGDAIAGFNAMASAAERVGSSVAGIIDTGVRMGASIAIGASLAAGAAGLGLIHKGLVDVNASMENAQLGFATMFRMFGATSSMEGGLGMAKTLIEGIRQDAAALPGELGDFVLMAKTMTGPLAGMGKGVEDIRRVTRETVVTAAALGVEYQQAAREFNMLMMGHAGGHNVLGNLLGIHHDTLVKTAQGMVEFNKASQGDRLALLEGMMKKAAEATDYYARSWGGLTSTLIDAGKRFLGTATAPLFERVKDSMMRAVEWTNTHQDQIEHLANLVGGKLANAWLFLEEQAARIPGWIAQVEERWDSAKARVLDFAHTLHEAFEKVWPLIEKIGGFLEKKLENPIGSMKELLAIRLGAGAMQMAPSFLGAGQGLMDIFGSKGTKAIADATEQGMVSAMSRTEARSILFGGMEGNAAMARSVLFGGEEAAAAAAPVGGGAAAEGAAAMSLGGPVALAASAAALSVFVAAIDNVGGSATRISEQFGTTMVDLEQMGMTFADKGGIFRDVLGAIGSNILDFATDTLHTLDMSFQAINWSATQLNGAWSNLDNAIGHWIDHVRGIDTSSQEAAQSSFHLVDAVKGFGTNVLEQVPVLGKMVTAVKFLGIAYDTFVGKVLGDDVGAGHTEAEKMAGADVHFMQKTGGGGMQIVAPQKETSGPPTVDARGSKIEIKLDARNDSPDRIVRRIFDATGRALLRPITSANSPVPAGLKGY